MDEEWPNYESWSSSSDDSVDSNDDSIALGLPLIKHHLRLMQQLEVESMKCEHGGSKPGRKFKRRNYEETLDQLENNYFVPNPLFDDYDFRCRFRMSKKLFTRVLNGLEESVEYFEQKIDAAGKLGLPPKMKVTVALRILAFGSPDDRVGDRLDIADSTGHECLKYFCDAIVKLYGAEYLRAPNQADVERLLAESEKRGWPGMLGSIGCMQWRWKNCPPSWVGHDHVPTVVLEAVATQDLWICHTFFGMVGSHNDLNGVDRSAVFGESVNGTTHLCNFVVNGHHYDMGYYLSDCIYPEDPTLIQTISRPSNQLQKYFAKKHEAARKDIKRAFGVLQGRWAFLRSPCKLWYLEIMVTVLRACIILHNMVVEDERGEDIRQYIPDIESAEEGQAQEERQFVLSHWVTGVQRDNSKDIHSRLKTDLMWHLWNRMGNLPPGEDGD